MYQIVEQDSLQPFTRHTYSELREVRHCQQTEQWGHSSMLDDLVSEAWSITWTKESKTKYLSVMITTKTAVKRKPISLPAMFPRAQTACSLIWGWGDWTRLMKAGMAPPPTTAAVWSDVPEAMLVRAQAASNWIGGESASPRKATNLGIRPALMMWSMGGCLSRDSSFLHLWGETTTDKQWMSHHSNCNLTSVYRKTKPAMQVLSTLPCSLCSLELQVKVVAVHPTGNLLNCPLPGGLQIVTYPLWPRYITWLF